MRRKQAQTRPKKRTKKSGSTMNAKEMRRRLLAIFPEERQSEVEPVIDALIRESEIAGIMRGRSEAATMIEVLVMGKADPTTDDLKAMMRSLRGQDPEL